MAEKLQQILDSLNWFVPKSLPWFCQIRENVSVHGLHTSNNWGSRFFCGFSGSQRHVTSKVSRDCSFLHFSPLIYLKESSSLSEAFLLGIALVRLHQINLNSSCVQLLVNSWLLWTAAFILFWHPGPYFPYHLIFNRPQPAWDCLSMPGCFDLHSILWSLIWSEKLFILDPFPAVFPSLLSPFKLLKVIDPCWKTAVGLLTAIWQSSNLALLGINVRFHHSYFNSFVSFWLPCWCQHWTYENNGPSDLLKC